MRVTQEDIDRYGETFLEHDDELELERVLDDPEARFRISGPAPKPQYFTEQPLQQPKPSPHPPKKMSRKRGWLATLLGR